jgi:hypothetical protein
VLYPAGTPVSQLYYQAAVKLPAGWTCATALDSAKVSAAGIEYQTVSLENLIDSPVLGGAHVRRIDLGRSFGAKVDAYIYCSSEAGLDFKPDFVTKLNAIVRQADSLFGARHFDHYRFLIALSDITAIRRSSIISVSSTRPKSAICSTRARRRSRSTTSRTSSRIRGAASTAGPSGSRSAITSTPRTPSYCGCTKASISGSATC